MAFLFRPPESMKRNVNSPKLSLPTTILRNIEMDGSFSSNNPIQLDSTPVSSGSNFSNSTLVAKKQQQQQQQQYGGTPTSINSNSTLTNNRPIPPSLPPSSLRTSSTELISQEFNTDNNNCNPISDFFQMLNRSDNFNNNNQYSYMQSEIITLGMLGEGAGGSVAKCRLRKNSSQVFALKTINTLNTDPEFQKQLFRELEFNKSFKSNYIVTYYGMFNDTLNGSIYIAMEYMGGQSLDTIYKSLLSRGGRIGEKILGKIAESVLRGLSYLHERKIIHRDIKPQNILLNEEGEVKLCDFGVSGEAVNSLATTFTGTSFYMAPERIQGLSLIHI